MTTIDRKAYVLTDRAGDWVAGQRVRIGGEPVLGTAAKPLMLSERQAAHDLRLGAIALHVPRTAAAAPAPVAEKPGRRQPRRASRGRN